MRSFFKLAKLALKNPELARNKLRTTYSTRLRALWDYHFRDGRAALPNAICIRLSNACNLRCRMCGQPREGHSPGDPKYAPPEFFRQKTSLEVYRRLLDELAPMRPNLYLWGGEPFLYPQLFELIHEAKSRRFTVQINTNGLLLHHRAGEIVESGLDDLIVSIDGPEEIHDRVRGRQGVFAKVKAGLAAVIAEKKARNASKPLIRIRGTISPESFATVSLLPAIAAELGADSLNFNWTWFTTKETGTAHQRLMRELFGIEAVSWRPFESDVIFDPERSGKYEGIRNELSRLYSADLPLPVSLSPALKADQVEAYYENIHETFGHRTCTSIYVKSYILPNGDVTPCPDFPDYICGNIHEQSFREIWNGEKYRRWRQELKRRGLFPICYRCCDLFLSDVKFL
ncbi:MAG: radical SAM protein [candidate division KSB1 bacterium]|nr:radical SAM protein [candidate division KSB1 bacterium]